MTQEYLSPGARTDWAKKMNGTIIGKELVNAPEPIDLESEDGQHTVPVVKDHSFLQVDVDNVQQ